MVSILVIQYGCDSIRPTVTGNVTIEIDTKIEQRKSSMHLSPIKMDEQILCSNVTIERLHLVSSKKAFLKYY